MFDVSIDINSIEKLDKYIEFVNKMVKMQNDKSFQEFIKNKCWLSLVNTMNSRLKWDNTNSDAIDLYISSNYIEDLPDGSGFIIYNNAKIEPNVNGVQNIRTNYPEEGFSIAMAFEYGVGIIGFSTSDNANAWDFNVNDYNFGWYLPSEVAGKSGVQTAGYQGFEIYRYTAEDIKKNLASWVEEYFSKEV